MLTSATTQQQAVTRRSGIREDSGDSEAGLRGKGEQPQSLHTGEAGTDLCLASATGPSLSHCHLPILRALGLKGPATSQPRPPTTLSALKGLLCSPLRHDHRHTLDSTPTTVVPLPGPSGDPLACLPLYRHLSPPSSRTLHLCLFPSASQD